MGKSKFTFLVEPRLLIRKALVCFCGEAFLPHDRVGLVGLLH